MKTRLPMLVCLILFLYGIVVFGQIQSTLLGGAWNNGNTWTGGIPPTAGDDVIIRGPVYVTSGGPACNNITVNATGTLTSYASASWSLTVNGNFTNYGVVCDNAPANTKLYLYINGSIENHGTWNNFGVYAFGNTDAYISATQPFGIKQFQNNKTTGNFLALSNLSFNSTVINFGYKSLDFFMPLELQIQNTAELRDIVLGELCTLNGDSTTLLYNVSGSVISFTGHNRFGGGCMFTNVYNFGIFENHPALSYTVVINGNLENHGEIRDNPYYEGLVINFTGNLINNGLWSNYRLNATGTTDQFLFATAPFEVSYLYHNNASGNIIPFTDITFHGTNLRFNGHQMVLGGGNTVYFEGDADASDIVIMAGGGSLSAGEDYEFSNLHIDNGILSGTFNLANQCVFTNGLVNNGIIQNAAWTSYVTQILCDVYNHGTFCNHPQGGQLMLDITGDLFHYGTSWENEETTLTGTTNQYVHLLNFNTINNNFKVNSMITASTYQWYFGSNPILESNPLFSGVVNMTLNFLDEVDVNYVGNYQCFTDNGDSRMIYIVQDISGLLLDVNVFLEGPYNGTDMNTDLNPIIPLQQTLTVIGYNGPEEVDEIPNANVVDWIGVELRDAVDINSATASTTVGGQAAFLLRDGSIVDLDGQTPLVFDLAVLQNLFVVLWHRNHLPVISQYPLTESGGIYSYDFTTAASQAYGDNQSDLGGGFFGMIGGNVNADGIINEFDGTEIWYPQVGRSGYLQGDGNMDGQVNNQDKNDIWYPNFGKSEILPFEIPVCDETFIDTRDGQSYNAVQIGNQCWMAENLNIGTRIDGISDQSDNTLLEKYCYNDDDANCNTYGGLYQWNEMMQYVTTPGVQGICPVGWHVPTDEEWTMLADYLDGELFAGGKMKATGTIEESTGFWHSPNTGATNESGFTALPAGERYDDGNYYDLGYYPFFWSSDETNDPGLSWSRYLLNSVTSIYRMNHNIDYGFSVRCIKD